jgi:hypothetical protein
MAYSKEELEMFGISPPTKDLQEKPQKKKPSPKVEEGPEVWFSCRAKEGCPGKQARLLLKVKNPGGGALVRYRCLTCLRMFSIAT